ncbi:YcnI family copper-binding membrane protein [Rummeliibacillus stabekisii]|uniref:YncI copper-binding domain-containing protein n=1 Tax=Rummeliibacillus stabekisii TaxID=241244 RepID=A0A143H8I8_9BACL|nr:YcnI family protein [Rummeliibacillus stabekisii]AMW98053.1 hypothetical protein ATY39_00655 [Rummeliibacillus stabekisii]MBB5170302.1 uncharacterized protein YcnI [Rummeliibacillus stabekisii]GEL04562.1 hypothetical protein RST01_11890 [Rummeliibacillus stabekisii]
MKTKKKWLTPILATSILMGFTYTADAHVSVQPKESTTNAYEKYTMRVPVEKDINTTKVELKVPKGVSLVSVMPIPDWGYELKKDKDGQVSSVIWTAKKAGIKANEFMEFAFIGANPSKPGEVSWNALQTYKDGSVVKWTGAPDSDEPASVTTINKGDAEAGHNKANAQSEAKTTEAKAETSTNDSSNWLPITLSAVALLLALISLFRKKG